MGGLDCVLLLPHDLGLCLFFGQQPGFFRARMVLWALVGDVARRLWALLEVSRFRDLVPTTF